MQAVLWEEYRNLLGRFKEALELEWSAVEERDLDGLARIVELKEKIIRRLGELQAFGEGDPPEDLAHSLADLREEQEKNLSRLRGFAARLGEEIREVGKRREVLRTYGGAKTTGGSSYLNKRA